MPREPRDAETRARGLRGGRGGPWKRSATVREPHAHGVQGEVPQPAQRPACGIRGLDVLCAARAAAPDACAAASDACVCACTVVPITDEKEGLEVLVVVLAGGCGSLWHYGRLAVGWLLVFVLMAAAVIPIWVGFVLILEFMRSVRDLVKRAWSRHGRS